MAVITLTNAHKVARANASVALADSGTANSCLKLYTAQGGTLLGIRRLAKPCASVNAAGVVTLITSSAQDLVTTSGIATYGTWCDGNDNAIASGTVTDTAGAGPFKLGGTNGTQLYQGGIIQLATGTIG